MDIAVYADVIFTLNFLINLIIIKLTSFFMKDNPGTLRLCVSASLGAVYAVFIFFPSVSYLYAFPFKIAISMIMLKITSPRGNIVKLFKYTILFYMISFTLAGILLSLVYFGNIHSPGAPVIKNGIFYFDISLGKLIGGAGICYGVIALAMAVFKRNKNLGIKNLKISLAGKVCEIDALCDTGNLLTEPISQFPVIIAEGRKLTELFPNGIPDINSPDTFDMNMRLIPFSSLGKKDGMLIGFIPDEVTIDGKKTVKTVVAISPDILSVPGEYGALFNPNIMA